MKIVERPKVIVPTTQEEYMHLGDVSELAHINAEAKRELAELTGWEIKTTADVWRVMDAVDHAVPARWVESSAMRTKQRMAGNMIAPLREDDVITPLARIRRERGMTQAQLAEATGMPFQAISRLERGAREIGNTRGETLLRLAQALGTTVDELIKK